VLANVDHSLSLPFFDQGLGLLEELLLNCRILRLQSLQPHIEQVVFVRFFLLFFLALVVQRQFLYLDTRLG